MANLLLKDINKIYPNKVQAVFDFNLEIKDKEFIVFVGPSGCGKSTTLRMVAGLEEISSGELYIDGELMNNVDPKDRNIAMVFQSYALYPHMTVYGNMLFALKLRKALKPVYLPSDEVAGLIEERNQIVKDLKKIDRAFKKDQNNFAKYLEPRAELYRKLYLKQEEIESKLVQQKGIDEYQISQLENQCKRIEKEIAYNEKVITICDKNNADDMKLAALLKETDEKRKKQLEDIKSKIEFLKINEVPLAKPRRLTRLEMDIEINKVAESIDLVRYLFRKPGALSGGQRQRVALGRAIVRKPKVFLMDEPLSNLDAKLRVQTRSEITKIHKRVGATTIYVTHDQTEAMTMADRIVIMKDGVIQQIGSPEEVYHDPANKFVAGFIGSPAMNFMKGTYSKGTFKASIAEKKEGEEYILGTKEFELKLNAEQTKILKDYEGEEISIGVRPEYTFVDGDVNNLKPTKAYKCDCDFVELLGYEYIVYTYICGQRIILKAKEANAVKAGDTINISFDENKIIFFDKDGTRIK